MNLNTFTRNGVPELDPTWRFIPLSTANKPPRGCTLRDMPTYWRGVTATWAELSGIIGTGRGVGLLCEASGLVVIDCDVTYEVQMSGAGNSGTVRERKGIDDLKREAARYTGDFGQALTPTMSVRTPSGGYHLYYRQRPGNEGPVTSRGHREDWLIDVKASKNTWVVAPPTPGYSIILRNGQKPADALTVATLPKWLDRHIRHLNERTAPATRAPGTAGSLPSPPNVTGYDGDLWNGWISTITAWLAEANTIASTPGNHGKGGGWGNRIFQAARLFRLAGVPDDEADQLIIDAADPWNAQELTAARRHTTNGRELALEALR